MDDQVNEPTTQKSSLSTADTKQACEEGTDLGNVQNEFKDKFRVTAEDLRRLSGDCSEMIRKRHLYELRNDAKLRAVNYTQSYEEFKDIVDAAHLQPLSKDDKRNAKTKSRLWNSAVREE